MIIGNVRSSRQLPSITAAEIAALNDEVGGP
jgi:hypothetical protein